MININAIERTWARRLTMIVWVPVLFTRDFYLNIKIVLRGLGQHYSNAWRFNWSATRDLGQVVDAQIEQAPDDHSDSDGS